MPCARPAEPWVAPVRQTTVTTDRWLPLLLVGVMTAGACQSPSGDSAASTESQAPPTVQPSVGATPPGTVETQADAVVPTQTPGCGRIDVQAYLTATRLSGWAVGTTDNDVVTVYLPDERPELAARIRDALIAACGPRVSVTTGPGFKPANR